MVKFLFNQGELGVVTKECYPSHIGFPARVAEKDCATLVREKFLRRERFILCGETVSLK